MYITHPVKAASEAGTEQQRCGTQMQAASAAAATKEAVLNEERAALDARLQDTTAACTALETKVTGISQHLHLPIAGVSCELGQSISAKCERGHSPQHLPMHEPFIAPH